jgi:hypothetical protein
MTAAVIAIYRLRSPLFCLAAVILIGNLVASPIVGEQTVVMAVLVLVALVTAMVCVVLTFLVPRLLPVREPTTVRSPVGGRWLGMNSPASKIPSHGVRAYGQAYAIDLVHEPLDADRPVFGAGPAMRPPQDYPAFGQPVSSMIDGVVVSASDWRRDHRSRSTMPAVVYMMIEGAVREIGGTGFILGNHVTVSGADGVFATVAHLQRGSVTVAVGDTVHAGQQIGRCGNSGNTSEPHVHAQLMDRRSPWTALGLPLAFAGITLDDDEARLDGVPRNDQHMTA